MPPPPPSLPTTCYYSKAFLLVLTLPRLGVWPFLFQGQHNPIVGEGKISFFAAEKRHKCTVCSTKNISFHVIDRREKWSCYPGCYEIQEAKLDAEFEAMFSSASVDSYTSSDDGADPTAAPADTEKCDRCFRVVYCGNENNVSNTDVFDCQGSCGMRICDDCCRDETTGKVVLRLFLCVHLSGDDSRDRCVKGS